MEGGGGGVGGNGVGCRERRQGDFVLTHDRVFLWGRGMVQHNLGWIETLAWEREPTSEEVGEVVGSMVHRFGFWGGGGGLN